LLAPKRCQHQAPGRKPPLCHHLSYVFSVVREYFSCVDMIALGLRVDSDHCNLLHVKIRINTFLLLIILGIRATATTSLTHFLLVKCEKSYHSNRINKLLPRNPSRHSPPLARELRRANPPRNITSSCACAPFRMRVPSLRRREVGCRWWRAWLSGQRR
jgi:hypothetical protein